MGTSTEELNSDIARTRAELSQDVDALQDKVSPSAIIERRKTAVRDKLSSAKDKVMGSGQGATQGVSSATSSAGSAIEDRVEGSPLAAGLVAFGAGLVIAGLIPASKAEAQGAQRLKEAAQEHGQPIMDQAKSAAQEVGEQLKDKATEAATRSRPAPRSRPTRSSRRHPRGPPTTLPAVLPVTRRTGLPVRPSSNDCSTARRPPALPAGVGVDVVRPRARRSGRSPCASPRPRDGSPTCRRSSRRPR